MLVLAAGGDPHREISLEDVAIVRLADELDSPAHRVELEHELAAVAREAAGLPAIGRAVTALRSDRDGAWRWIALALVLYERSRDEEGAA